MREIVRGKSKLGEQVREPRPRIVPASIRLRDQVIELVVDLPRGPAGQVGYYEHRRRNTFAFEHRQRELIDISIAIVERDCGNWFVERLTVEESVANLVERHEPEMRGKAFDV